MFQSMYVRTNICDILRHKWLYSTNIAKLGCCICHRTINRFIGTISTWIISTPMHFSILWCTDVPASLESSDYVPLLEISVF